MKKKFLFLFLTCCLCGCSLLAPTVQVNYPVNNYQYVYIIPTTSLTSGYTSSSSGSGITKSINPTDISAGEMMKRGYAILPELQDELKARTIVVSYGETGSRIFGLLGYTKEVIIQFRDASNSELIASCVAEGMGSTEADDIRKAVLRALNSIFNYDGDTNPKKK